MNRERQTTLTNSLAGLLVEWSKAGRRLTRTTAGRCVVPGCSFMAFVALKTESFDRPVCLKHHELLDESNALIA